MFTEQGNLTADTDEKIDIFSKYYQTLNWSERGGVEKTIFLLYLVDTPVISQEPRDALEVSIKLDETNKAYWHCNRILLLDLMA